MLSKQLHTWSAVGFKNPDHQTEQDRLHTKIIAKQTGGGGGALILHKRNGVWCAVLCRERFGNNAGDYNLPCGKHEDSGQVITTIQREAFEEFGYAAKIEKISCRHVLGKTALIQKGTGAGIVLACVVLNTRFSRATVNQQMQSNNNNSSFPSCYKEMDAVELVPLENILKLPRDGKPQTTANLTDTSGVTKMIMVTSFAIAAVHDFHKIGCF